MILATFLQNMGRWGLLMALLLAPNPELAGTLFSSPTMTATLTTPSSYPDPALLKTALAKFFQSTAFRTESTLVITTTTAQVNVNFKSQTETLEETMHRHQSNPDIPPDAFQFRPSPLFTRVEEVPLDPF